MAARVFAIVDVYDALTGERSYKPAWSHRMAMRQIQAAAGTHFDPELVKAFQHFMEMRAAE